MRSTYRRVYTVPTEIRLICNTKNIQEELTGDCEKVPHVEQPGCELSILLSAADISPMAPGKVSGPAKVSKEVSLCSLKLLLCNGSPVCDVSLWGKCTLVSLVWKLSMGASSGATVSSDWSPS